MGEKVAIDGAHFDDFFHHASCPGGPDSPYAGIVTPVAVVAFLGGFAFKYIFAYVSRRMGERLRRAYFGALLANDATWHTSQGGSVCVRECTCGRV